MRQKTDSRRQAILDAAIIVFHEMGYERASMAEISARVGGSKATLYSYFCSKEELFAEAMHAVMQEQGEAMLGLLDARDPDVRTVLLRFGRAYIDFLTTPEAINGIRTAIAEGAKSRLGETLYRNGSQRGWARITAYIAQLMEQGSLPPGNAHVAALHLKGMLEAGISYPILFGAQPELDKEAAVESATAAFLRAYG